MKDINMKDVKIILVLIVYVMMGFILSIILQMLGKLQVFGVPISIFYASSIGMYLSLKIINLIQSTARDE